ncbi:hypothetical protein Tco_0285390 [Tanacetum coccineum]
MYKEYLAEFWYSAKALENSKVSFSTPTGGIYGEVGVNTFRNAIGAHYLPHSSEYVAPPSIDIVRPWFETIGYGEAVPAKGTLKKSLLPPRKAMEMENSHSTLLQVFSVHNWALKPNQPGKNFPSSTQPGAKPGHKKLLTSSKQPFVSNNEATTGGSSKAPTSSKTSHYKKRKESSSAMDSNPSQPPVSPVDTGTAIKQELTCNWWAISVGSPVKKSQTLSSVVGMNEGTKNTSYDHLFAEQGASSIARQTSFKDLDSPEDDLVIVVDDTDEDEEDEVHATIIQKHKLDREKNKAKSEDALTFMAQPSFPSVGQLNELLVKSLQTEFSKYLSAHDFSSSLPTELKDLPSKFNDLTKEVKGLKIQVHNLEIIAELKTLQWELPVEFLSLPKQVKSVQAKLKTLDALPTGDQSVPLAGQAKTMPAEGEKNTNQATISQLFQRRAKTNAEKENPNNQ